MHQDYYSTRSSRFGQASNQQFKLMPPNSLSSKRQEKQISIPMQNYSVPCMNCESLVAIEEIDNHAAACCKVSKNVTAVQKSNSWCDEINFKITKLRESLQQFCMTEQRQENMKYLIRADEICEQLFNIQHNSQIEIRKLIDLNQELKTLTEQYRGSLCVALYLERLHSLSLQKQSQLERLSKPMRLEMPKALSRQQDTSRNSYQGNGFSIQSQGLKSGLGRPTMITKFSGSQERSQQMDMKSEILTKISTSQFDGSEDNYQDFDNNQGQFGQNQRIFYSKCLALKTQLSNNHPGQKIPLCILHKEMIQRKLPQSSWEKFITDALNNPSQYLDMGKVQNSQGLRNNLKSMASESQLKQRLSNL